MRPPFRLLYSLLIVLGACRPSGGAEQSAPVAEPARPLAFLATQQLVVAPLNRLREADALGWTQQIPRSREFMRAFDEALQAELGARGLSSRWVYPPALVQAGRNSPSYAVDPYALAAGPLRSPSAAVGVRVADPLAGQLRTMVALQESARAVLIPAELWFDRTPDGQGVAVVRLALVDGRTTEIRWIGDVRGTPQASFSRELVTSLVAHTADLFAAP
ncbi:MAG: hypothetical protein HOQ19_08620 [Gemmatimonadaceae bacterium]|nr:hypothetical protein [Gemmatimonadaceae bacterium]NUP55882.1 hypothetical protein [Gemmatimonadaceae bacterium]